VPTPLLDDTAVAVRLRAATARLARRLRRETDAPATQSQMSALGAIERLEPVTLGDLAAFEQVTPPTMTRVVQALEAAGWVGRTADPADRRVSRIALAPAGVAMIARVRSSRDAWMARRLAELSPADRAAVPELVALLERLADCQPEATNAADDGPTRTGKRP
jgi:DNA-binding MarR family transcriptional regulator